jgi:hypothetical protein
VQPVLAPPPPAKVEPGPVPTFSVIIAAYQVADRVGEAVESALQQTVRPHEVIVCDDGSSDDIEGALEPYRDQIIFLREDHRGPGAAKDAAARAASGDFVAILDADDAYRPERLEAVGKLASARPDLDILTTDADVELDGRVIRRFYDVFSFDVADQRKAILRQNFIFAHAAVRRERLIEVGGFDESLPAAVDWDCWLRLIFSGSAAGLLTRPLVRYRVRESALSANPPVALNGAVQVLEKAARSLEMSPAERAVLTATLAERRRDASLQEAHDALREGAPDARRRALAIATERGYSLPTRAKAVLAAAAPAAGRRLLVARDRRSWVGATGVQVSRRNGQA